MKKYLGLLVVLTMAFAISTVAKAEDDVSSNTGEGATTSNVLAPEQKRINAETRVKAQADLKVKREAVRTEVKDKRMEVKTQAQENRQEIKDERKEVKEEVKLKREELKKELEAKKEEMKEKREAMKEETKQKIGDLKAKIKEEKDGAKARIKELRVVGREKALERFDAAVERMNNLKNKGKEPII